MYLVTKMNDYGIRGGFCQQFVLLQVYKSCNINLRCLHFEDFKIHSALHYGTEHFFPPIPSPPLFEAIETICAWLVVGACLIGRRPFTARMAATIFTV